jgi:hypothetical protein
MNGFTLLTVTQSPSTISAEVLHPLQLNEDQTSDTVTGAVCAQKRESVCLGRVESFVCAGRQSVWAQGECVCAEGGRVRP